MTCNFVTCEFCDLAEGWCYDWSCTGVDSSSVRLTFYSGVNDEILRVTGSAVLGRERADTHHPDGEFASVVDRF